MARGVRAVRPMLFLILRQKRRFIKIHEGAFPHIMFFRGATRKAHGQYTALDHIKDCRSFLLRNFHAKGFAEHGHHLGHIHGRLGYGQGCAGGIGAHGLAPLILRHIVGKSGRPRIWRSGVKFQRIRKIFGTHVQFDIVGGKAKHRATYNKRK